MAQVQITGCTPDLDYHRITFVKLLQSEAHLSLKAAKEYMERCVLGERVVIDVPTAAQAEHLAKQASKLGVLAHVSGVTQPQ